MGNRPNQTWSKAALLVFEFHVNCCSYTNTEWVPVKASLARSAEQGISSTVVLMSSIFLFASVLFAYCFGLSVSIVFLSPCFCENCWTLLDPNILQASAQMLTSSAPNSGVSKRDENRSSPDNLAGTNLAKTRFIALDRL